MRDLKTAKKSLFVIGENRGGFGYENAPKFASELIKVPLDPSIRIDSITKVKAQATNSYIGNWEENPKEENERIQCGGTPGHLKDLVCNQGHGECVGFNTCRQVFCNLFFLNFYFSDTLHSFSKDAMTITSIGRLSPNHKEIQQIN